MNGMLKSAALIVLGAFIAIGLSFAFLQAEPETVAPGQNASAPTEVGGDTEAVQRIAALERQLDEVNAQNQQLMTSLDTSKQMVTVLEQSLDDVAALSEDPEAEEKEKSPMAKMLENMGTEKMARAQAGAMVQMGYSKLFQQLQLDAATKEDVREILLASSTEQLQEQFRIMASEEDVSREDRRAADEDRKARMRNDLAQLLTRDQLDAYDNYDVEREAMAGSLDMQLGMMAGELTQENRELARDVMIEEMRAMQAEREASRANDQTIRIGSAAATAGLDSQIQMMQNSVDRLAQMLEPDQLAIFEAYVQQQMDMYEGVRGLVDETEEITEESGGDRRTRRVVVSFP